MIEKLKLYYGVDIVVNNTRILKNRYTGKFRTKDGVGTRTESFETQ